MSIIAPGKREFYMEMYNLLSNIQATKCMDENIQAVVEIRMDEIEKMLDLYEQVPLIYVAGQYFPDTKEHGEKAGILHWLMHENIEKARKLGAQCAELGWYPMIPHTNTAWMSGLQDHHWWYDATNEMLRVCDAIIMVPGWKESHGATLEHDEAKRMDINVYYDIAEVPDLNIDYDGL